MNSNDPKNEADLAMPTVSVAETKADVQSNKVSTENNSDSTNVKDIKDEIKEVKKDVTDSTASSNVKGTKDETNKVEKDDTDSDASKILASQPEAILPFAGLKGMEKFKCILDTWESVHDYTDVNNQNICCQTLKALSQCYWREQNIRTEMADLLLERNWIVTSHTALKVMTKTGMFASDPIWFSSYYILNSMWNFSDCSLMFAKKIHDADILTTMKSYITHEPFLQELNNSKNIFYVVKSALSITHNVSRAPDVVATFKQLDIPKAVRPFLQENSYTKDEFLQALSALILANISEDGDDLSDTERIIDYIVMCMKKALEHVKRRYRGFNPSELAHGLSKLTATDANKFKIVEAGALPLFNNMLQCDDLEQQLSAASAIWGLAFDDNARKRILSEPGLMDSIESLLETTNNDAVRKSARGAVWTVKRELDHRSKQEEHQTKSGEKPLIFLSYSWGNQEMTLKIHRRLQSLGHNVWIDVEQMSENLLECMAEGIEQATVIVMCVSETYKDSPNCRTEAEYSYKLNKPIVPVVLQSGYRATGWLGLILGTKFYYDFDRIPFEEIFTPFHKELSNKLTGTSDKTQETIHKASSSTVTNAPAPKPVKPPAVSKINKWSEAEIANWLNEINLQKYKSAFQGIDGKSLYSMYQLKSEAPEYFYRLLETNIQFTFADLLKFRSSLDKLIDDNC